MRLTVLFLLTALAAFGADVAGKWKATFEGQNGPREVTFLFQVADGKITGTVSGPQGDAPISNVKMDGDKLTFTVERDQFKAVFTGTVSGDELKLNGQVGERNFELAAKRLKD